jgi:two-component system, cell cycle response regulator
MTQSGVVVRRAAVDRNVALTVLRVTLAAMVLLVPAVMGTSSRDLVTLTAAYLAVVGITVVARWRWPFTSGRIAPVMPIVDSAYVVGAVVATQGTRGSLGPVPYLLIAGVAVLTSPRAALVTALSCASFLALARVGTDAHIVALSPRPVAPDIELSSISYAVMAIVVGACVAVHDAAARRRSERVRKLIELGATLEHVDRDDELALALAGHAREVLGFRRAVVALRSGDGWCGATVGAASEESFVRAEALGITDAAALDGHAPVLVHALEPGLLATVLPRAQNVVVAGIIANHGARGLVAGEWGGRRRTAISAATVRALVDAAAQAGHAVEVRDRLDEAARLATRDALTGLANRRLFGESLGREIARAERLGTPLSLLVFDVDHFKSVNDTLGHQVGDHVLRQVGNALVTHTKGSDLAARFGGDEFVVLLPGCSSRDVEVVGERLRVAVSAGLTAALASVSGGFATFPDHAESADGLMAVADAALYRAKRAGRDQIAGPEGSPIRGG